MNAQRRRIFGAIAFAGLGAAGLASCATNTGPPFEAAALPPIPPGQARLIVFYLSTWTVPNIWRAVEVDGKTYGDIGMGQFMLIDVPPGHREVRLWSRPLFGGPVAGAAYVRHCELAAGQTAYMMFMSVSGGYPVQLTILLDQVPEEVALQHLRGMGRVEQGVVHMGQAKTSKGKRKSAALNAASVPSSMSATPEADSDKN